MGVSATKKNVKLVLTAGSTFENKKKKKKLVLTATCQQQPPVNNNLTDLFQTTLCIETTFSGPEG
jgi:hypothetical protein